MEPLYPQNIVERTLPVLRELREKAEREESSRLPKTATELAKDEVGEDDGLYENVPYEEGKVGTVLNTLA